MQKRLVTIALSFVILSSGIAAIPDQSRAASDKTLQVVSGVSFRGVPNVNGDPIRYLMTGETAVILEKVNAYWYKIKDRNGEIGYVSANAKYVSTNYQEPALPSIPKSETEKKVIAAGIKYLGTPYEFGSSRSNTLTFDCSDFVRQAYIDGIGLKLPADSRSQGDYVKRKGNIKTDWRQLKPGDIMFFMAYKGSTWQSYKGVNKLMERITHNGIYLGDGKILQTYSVKSGGVRIDSIAGTQWEKRYLFGGSPL